MKKIYTTFLLISCLACVSCDASNNNDNKKNQKENTNINNEDNSITISPPNIDVTVKGYNSGRVYLVGYYTGNPYIVDSTTVNSAGNFTFESKEAYPAGYYFFNLPDNKTIQLLLDKDQEFNMKTDINDVANTMVIDGSIDNKLMYEEFIYADKVNTLIKAAQKKQKNYNESDPNYKKLKEEIDSYVNDKKSYLNDIFNRYPDTFFTIFKKSGQNPELIDVRNPDGSVDTNTQIALYRRAFFNNVDFSDSRLLYTPVISNKLDKYITSLTAQNPDSIILSASELIEKVKNHPDYFNYFANWITLKYEVGKTNIMDAEAIHVFMIQSYFTYDLAFWSDSTTIYRLQTRASEMEASLVGKKGPNIISKNQNGETKSLYEITSPYIIVFMYSPDCEHCQKEIPKLVSFHKEWKSKGVSVFAIALDTQKEEWENLITKNKMNDWTNVYDPSNKSIYKKYYVDITPELYILNADRTIIGKNLKVNQIETIINRDKSK